MATWPATLPLPLRPNYELRATDPTARTDMDSGPARVRRRYTAAPDQISLSYRFSAAQMAVFRAFWEADFAHGAAWVNLPLIDGRTADIVYRACRPTSAKFSATPVSAACWTVEFEVEVRNA